MTMAESQTASGDVSPGASPLLRISVVIPTYQRERVLVETIDCLLRLQSSPAEILVVDQTAEHEPDTERVLAEVESAGKIRWIQLSHPSITHAMNVGLEHARNDIVLFLDDDIIPDVDLVSAHARAQAIRGCNIVAGQVLQPGEEPASEEPGGAAFRFSSSGRRYISELMGGNFSIKRKVALDLGGFDENFVHVAYRFEAEFASRALAAGEKIWFEPEASIRHLKASSGGTRSYGEHLTTIKPSHSVGEYYYLLRSKGIPRRLLKIITRPLRAIKTRHHLSHPWWIPGTFVAETWGFLWAVTLAARGPRLIGSRGRRSEVGDRRSEVRGQRSEVGDQRSEVRDQRSDSDL
jgi:GT2 family glycosyltransferase